MLALAGLVPEVGAGAVDGVYEVPYTALRSAIVTPTRQLLEFLIKPAIGMRLQYAEQKVLWLIKNGGPGGTGIAHGCTWLDGKCTPFPEPGSLTSVDEDSHQDGRAQLLINLGRAC